MPSYTFKLSYNLILSEEHYTAIGKVAAVWQILEIAIQIAIWASLGVEADQGKLLTAALRFDTHLDIMGVLAATIRQNEANPVDVPALIKSTKALQGERNSIVHGLWNPFSNPISPESLRVKMKASSSPPTYTPEQMVSVADSIYAAHLQWIDYAVARFELRQTPAPQNPPPTTPRN